MDKNHSKFLLGISLGVAVFLLSQSGAAIAAQGCGTIIGVADLKEGGGSKKRAQYWINGFPGKSSPCSYTLELCFVEDGNTIGSKIFMTSADGRKHQASGEIRNCHRGWSTLLKESVTGAQQILVAIPSGYTLNVRFISNARGFKFEKAM
ncbi:MAG: hypothetical protein OEZ04_06525 [Nitrospinota bacterium]|nr:hypothetical protein [Nitrospinota bacterium]